MTDQASMPPKVAPLPRNRLNFELTACLSSSFAECERSSEAMFDVSNGKAIRRKCLTSRLASAREAFATRPPHTTPQMYFESVHSHAQRINNSLAINYESTCAIANIPAHATKLR